MNRMFAALASAALMSSLALPAQAVGLSFSGPLAVVDLNNGGHYSGSFLGTGFSGVIDDTTAAGYITDGTLRTDFGCCIAAGGLSILNDVVLGADQASLLNQLFGGANYSAGDLIDQVDIEGDSATAGGGRIEVGLSFVFAPTTFASSSDVGAFNPAVASHSLFFIFEEDLNGVDLYSGLGPASVAAVPWPAPVWLMGAGLAVVGGAVRRQRVSG